MEIQFSDPIKQRVWQTLRALNDTWTKGNPDELANFFHPDMLAITPTDQHRREGRERCIAGWKAFSTQTTIREWKEIDPLVNVYGNSAVVAYYYEIVFEANGKTYQSSGRDMFFFVLENGRWWAVADHFSSYP